MAALEEAIRLVLETEGKEGITALRKELAELGNAGELTREQVGDLAGEVLKFGEAAADAEGIQRAIKNYESLAAKQGEVAEAVEQARLKLGILSEAETEAARAVEASRKARDDARASLAAYQTSVDKTAEGLAQQRESVNAAAAALKESETRWGSITASLATANREFDVAYQAQERLNSGLQKQGDAIRAAGLSTDDLAGAQAELAKRSEEAGRKLAEQVENARRVTQAQREQAEETRRLAEETEAAAAAAAKAEKEFADAFRALGGDGTLRDTASEMERLQSAYDTLASSGKLSTEQLSRAQDELNKRLQKLREGTAEYRAEQERAAQAQAQAAAFAKELAQETARAEAEAEDFAKALKRQADAADKAANESAELNREGERGSAVFSKLKGVLAGVAAAFSFTKIAGAVKSVFEEASKAEQATAQLEAALASTGNAAGITSAELSAMAQEMRSVTNFTDEQIQSAQTRLLSYTDIARNEFPAALQIVLDQSARLGMSVEQSAEIVGRALQSPSKAMQSLADQGFKFTAQQKEMLKSLEATGRMAEAQAMIMDMLAESYGGAALAQRVGMLSGALKGMGDVVDDLQRKLVDKALLGDLRDEINDTSKAVEAFSNSPEFARLKDSFDFAFRAGLESVKLFRETADIPGLTSELSGIVQAFGDIVTITNALEARTGAVSAGFDGLQKAVNPIRNLLPLIQDGLHGVSVYLQDVNETLPGIDGAATRAASGLDVLAVAAKAVQQGLAELRAQTIDEGISAGAVTIAAKLRDAADSATAAKTEIAGLIAGLSDMSPGEIGDVAMGIAQVASESERAGKNVRDGLVASLKNLSGEQLLAFSQASKQAFDTFNTGAEKAATVSETVLLTALERLGLQGEQLGVPFTEASKDIIATFQTIAEQAGANATQINNSFKAALKNVATKEEADALLAALSEPFRAGKISADDMARAVELVEATLNKLKEAAGPLADAFKTLQVQSREALKNTADEAGNAFERIYNDAREKGEATAGYVQESFAAYARKMIAFANSGTAAQKAQIETMLQNKAAALGLTDVLEGLGLCLDNAIPPTNRFRVALKGLGDQADETGEQIESLADATRNMPSVAGFADKATYSLGEMSKAAAEAYEAANKLTIGATTGSRAHLVAMNRVTEELVRQQEAYEQQVIALEKVAAGQAELWASVELGTREYDYLTTAQNAALAAAYKRAEEAVAANQKEAESVKAVTQAVQEKNAQLKQQAQQQTQTIKQEVRHVIEVIFSGGNLKIDIDSISDPDVRRLAERLLDQFERMGRVAS